MYEDTVKIAQSYLGFAELEAKGVSTIYERLAREVAECATVLQFLATLPVDKRQPNLLFAALRYLVGVPKLGEIGDIVCENSLELAELMKNRRTQTNEPGRCATLMPFLSAIGQPIALIEVGASAGLCLLPDKYAYTYVTKTEEIRIQASEGAPEFRCTVEGEIDLPDRHPEIVWRRGLDLNPLSAASENDAAWLRTLVWPEHEHRRARLDKALRLAAATPELTVETGDLSLGLNRILAEVPSGSVPVIFHSAVLSYVQDRDQRETFQKRMLASDAVWISNEAPSVFRNTNGWMGQAARGLRFLTRVDGMACAWSAPYGDRLSGIKSTENI